LETQSKKAAFHSFHCRNLKPYHIDKQEIMDSKNETQNETQMKL